MGILSWIGLGAELAKPIEAISTLYTTEQERITAQKSYEEIAQKPRLAQLENNKIMSLANNVFENSWQPLIGYTAGFCVGLYYIPQLIVANIIWAQECLEVGHVIPFPVDPTDIINLVYLLFGFGTYHLVKKKILG